MTENEAIKNINALNAVCMNKEFYDTDFYLALSLAVVALKKIQEFEEIGTIEEFKALKEKNVVKPTVLPFYGGRCTCGTAIGNKSVKYCYMCGAEFDWQ